MRYWACAVCSYAYDECECDSGPTRPEQERVEITVSVTYPQCQHTVSVLTDSRIPERCPACATGIPEGSTRCEDFPCCGHTDGDGCMPRPEHTSAYWSRLMGSMSQDEWDDYSMMMEMREDRY